MPPPPILNRVKTTPTTRFEQILKAILFSENKFEIDTKPVAFNCGTVILFSNYVLFVKKIILLSASLLATDGGN